MAGRKGGLPWTQLGNRVTEEKHGKQNQPETKERKIHPLQKKNEAERRKKGENGMRPERWGVVVWYGKERDPCEQTWSKEA